MTVQLLIAFRTSWNGFPISNAPTGGDNRLSSESTVRKMAKLCRHSYYRLVLDKLCYVFFILAQLLLLFCKLFMIMGVILYEESRTTC